MVGLYRWGQGCTDSAGHHQMDHLHLLKEQNCIFGVELSCATYHLNNNLGFRVIYRSWF